MRRSDAKKIAETITNEQLNEMLNNAKENIKDWSTYEVPIEYQAVIDIMKTLEKKGENDVRVVFWFDN